MRLPIQSMQAVRIRPVRPEEPHPWYRSVIVDFHDSEELQILVPDEEDLEASEKAAEVAPAGAGAGPDRTSEAAEEEPDDEVIRPPPFDRGTHIEVEISFPDGIRRFTSTVRRLELSHGGSMRVDWPTEGTRIQRRDYVRVEFSCRALVWYREDDSGLKQLNGTTIDFSAGGVRLKLPQPLPDEMRIEVEIQTPPLEAQTLQGRVVRSGRLESKRGEEPCYWVAVEFVGVDEALRKEMTQFVFGVQRKQMRQSLA